MEKKKKLGIELLKFLAAIMITNSHFIPLYKEVNIGLATLGVHGNALFFFVAGFLLTMGFQKTEHSIGNWYKRRLQRLWPAVFLWALLSSIIWQEPLTWQKIIIAPEYWFLQTIAVYYLLFFFVGRILVKQNEKVNKGVFLIFVVISIVYAFIMPQGLGSMFHTQWHFVCHFSIMILGGVIYLKKDCIKVNKWWADLLLFAISFIAYFAIQSIGKNATNWLWYTQIVSLIPLHTFCYYAYKVTSYSWADRLMTNKVLKWPFVVTAALTLEIYIVQFDIISDAFNFLFPLNTIIVFAFILISAYLLRILANVFFTISFERTLELKRMFSFKMNCLQYDT